MRTVLRVSMATGLVAVVAFACFSERAQVTGPPAGGECLVPLEARVPGSVLVVVRDFTFEPAEVRVRAGGTVTWVNCADPSEPAHTSTADGGGWSSPLLAPGQAFSHVFPASGSFPYHCEPHPFMTGRVVVE